VWAATAIQAQTAASIAVSIHAARVGSDSDASGCIHNVPVSIHAARVGSDDVVPAEGLGGDVSIHAARVGSDARWLPELPD